MTEFGPENTEVFVPLCFGCWKQIVKQNKKCCETKWKLLVCYSNGKLMGKRGGKTVATSPMLKAFSV